MSGVDIIAEDPMISELFPNISPLSPGDGSESDFAKVAQVWHDHFSTVSSLHNPQVDYLRGRNALHLERIFYGQHFYPGTAVRRHLLHLQLLCSAAFQRTYHTKRDNIRSYILGQTFAGGGILIYEGKTYDLQPGDVFLVDCRLPHEYYSNAPEGWGYRFMHFDGIQMAPAYQQIMDNQNVVFHFSADSRFNELFRELFTVNRQSGKTIEIITNRILTDMLTEILLCLPQFTDKPVSKDVSAIATYLEHHYRESITLDEISMHCGMSKYHMCRLFKAEMGCSIFYYLKRYRVEIVKRYLRHSDMNISEIADLSGFDTHSSMYRCFRELEGMSPSEYRSQWNEI